MTVEELILEIAKQSAGLGFGGLAMWWARSEAERRAEREKEFRAQREEDLKRERDEAREEARLYAEMARQNQAVIKDNTAALRALMAMANAKEDETGQWELPRRRRAAKTPAAAGVGNG